MHTQYNIEFCDKQMLTDLENRQYGWKQYNHGSENIKRVQRFDLKYISIPNYGL